jgi:hypothetical protein
MPSPKNDSRRLADLADFMRVHKLTALTTPDGYQMAMHEAAWWPLEESSKGTPMPVDKDDKSDDWRDGMTGETPQQRIRRLAEMEQSIDKQRGSLDE